MTLPRRTCPACQRRYAGLIDPDCPVCAGLGVLTLGAPALHHHEPAAVARAAELYLEVNARRAIHDLPLATRRDALELATAELRTAGILSTNHDTGTPARAPIPGTPNARTITELDAHRTARTHGASPTNRDLNALGAPPTTDLTPHRPRDGNLPTASANGHIAALAVIADPIDPLGPDVAHLHTQRRARDHNARVLALATPTAATRRQENRP